MAITRRQKVAKVAAAKKRLKLPDYFVTMQNAPCPVGWPEGCAPYLITRGARSPTRLVTS